MTDKTKKIIRTVYDVAITIMTIALGLIFALHVLDIYFTGISPDFTGDKIFDPEDISVRLIKTLPYVIAWLVLIVVGVVLSIVIPKQKSPIKIDDETKLSLAIKRMPTEKKEGYDEQYSLIERSKKTYKVAFITALVLSLVSVIAITVFMILLYVETKDLLIADKVSSATGNVVKVLSRSLPFVVATGAIWIGLLIYKKRSATKLLGAVREISKGEKPQEIKKKGFMAWLKGDCGMGKKGLMIARISVAVVGVVFVIVGIFNGGMRDTFAKAVAICLECIGLG